MASNDRLWHAPIGVFLVLVMTSCGVTDRPGSSRDGSKPDAPTPVTVTATTSAPAVRLTSPRDGEVFSATAGPVEFVADVTTHHEDVSAVRFLSDGGEIIKVATPPYRVMYSPSQLGEGSHLLRAVAVTSRGEIESVPATIKVQPPVDDEVTADDLSVMTIGRNKVDVRIYVPKPEQRYRAPADIEIRPAALSTAGDIKHVEIIGDGRLISTRGAPPYDYVWRDVSRGAHIIVARAVTTTGKSAEASVTVHVE